MIRARNGADSGDLISVLLPDLTPMLDILFILLVFFMLAAGTALRALDLRLPSGEAAALTANGPPRAVLEIRQNGYALNGESLADFEELKSALSEVLEKTPRLIVASDRLVPAERLLRTLAHLRARNVRAADILMRPPDAQAEPQ